MCGICGFTGNKNEKLLNRMTASIFHRGPDEDGFYSDGQINLGMRRLGILDLETGKQPVHNEDKSIWVICNGEIYNFKKLRELLERKGHRFYTSHSDIELIVHLYEEFGRDFVHKLNGMFAIALWDSNNETLLLIRDRMGVKPLFYAFIQGNIIFSSEIKAILLHHDYKKEMCFEGLYHYFTLKNIPAPFTSFKDIYSILPGEMLIFRKNLVEKKCYWKIHFNEVQSDETYLIEKLNSILEDATKLRMKCDVPFGAYLSGGVDSSAIVALMTRFSDKPIKTFSLGYEDELKNKEADLYYARKVSKRYKTEHYEYIMSCRELIEDIEHVIGAFDQPFSGTISTYFLSKLIKKHVKVALSGDGADELFGSYLSHRLAQPMYYFKMYYDKVKTNTLTEEEKRLFSPCDTAFLNELFQESGGNEINWRYQIGLFSDKEKILLLNKEFSSEKTSSFKLFQKYFSKLTSQDPLNRILEMEWNTQLPDQVLAFVDFLSMKHSIEIRSPFLDYRLVEFVATIPGNLKIKDGIVKNILKNTLNHLLPNGITKRPKEGFVLPVYDWMPEKLKNFALSLLSEYKLKQHRLLNINFVRNLLQSYYSGNKSVVGKIWNLMMFQIWWEKYFA